MKPQLEKVADNFKGEGNCVVANFDADAAQNKALASKFDVKSYPTIKFFSSANKEPLAYEGARSEEAFTEFLNLHCGTHRAAGGGLNDKAGREPMLDAFAAKFVESVGDARESIYREAVQFATTAKLDAKHYIKVMEKVANGTEDYIAKETKRYAPLPLGAFANLARRLTNILAKKTLSPAKLDEIKIRANILASFVANKASEAEKATVEAAEEVVQKAKEEL